MKNLILLLLATILYWAIVPITFLLTCLFFLVTFKFNKLNIYLFDCAVSKDQHGGVYVRHLFNKMMTIKGGYPFGNPDETISSVLGKNKKNSKLTVIGKTIDRILSAIDPGHSISAIEEDENY